MKSLVYAVGFCALALPANAASITAYYLCADKTELTAVFKTTENNKGSVNLMFADSKKRIELPQVLSADGGRYASGDTEFWIKGKEATLRQGDRVTNCIASSPRTPD